MDRPQVSTKRVAVVIDNRPEYGRRTIRGVIDFANKHGGWEILYDFDYGLKKPPSSLRTCDGLITQSPHLLRAITSEPWGKARVGVFVIPRRHQFPTVLEDNHAVGELACRYLADLGFRRLAMCSLRYEFAAGRKNGFFAAASKLGLPKPQLLILPAPPWQRHLRAIETWLRRMQMPVALFAANDSIGRLVLEAARAVGMIIPEQAAVLGVDDDELLCRLTVPALSSIDHGAYQAGYEAAALLDRIMRGEPAPSAPLIIPPVGVITRRSTDSLAVSDPDAAMAIRHIRQNVRDGVTVRSILHAVPVSRTKLERDFRRLFGRSINQEILRCRIELAKEELIRGKSGMLEIALGCGFANRQHLNVAFKKLTGQTPTQFRARFQVEPAKTP